MKDIRLQANLGAVQQRMRNDLNYSGLISIARVTKVNHKNHTVDVVFTRTGDAISSSEDTEGVNACRILESEAGYDEDNKVYYGNITPLKIGDLVVIAYVDQYKHQPIVLGKIHDTTDELKNPFPREYPISVEDEKTYYQRLHIGRLQGYYYVNGMGEFEASHHSKAFAIGRYTEIDDSRNGFNYSDMEYKSKITKKPLESPMGKENFFPLNFLFSLQDKFDGVCNYLKVWISSKTSSFRISRDTTDQKLSFFEMDDTGTIRLKRQADSNIRNSGSQYSEVLLKQDGTFQITKSAGGTKAVISMDAAGNIQIETQGIVSVNGKNGVQVQSNSPVTVSSSNSVNVNGGSSVNLTASTINLNGNINLNGTVNCPNC